ncbi:MAG: type II toxin-antitoxin system HicB family antitoxin [Limosilactobacillus pontis]|uniref:type II toxin-antitoxin system HicB family antitoxin n=1 Tax=Limosilactobacillus pontis TaxID=35787 RepID=UPI0039A250BE
MKKERLVAYPAVLDDRDNEKGFYTVTFPDVPAAISQGKGIAEAIINGASALGLVLYDATPLPERSDIDVIKKNNKGTVVTYIAVDLNEAKKNVTLPVVKKNTTLPGDLAKKAEAAGINFSQTLKEALEKKLNK